MGYIKLIIGYLLMIAGWLLIRSQGVNYSNKKAIGLFVWLVGAVLLFLVAWWHILIGLFVSAIVGLITGKKSGIEKEINNNKAL